VIVMFSARPSSLARWTIPARMDPATPCHRFQRAIQRANNRDEDEGDLFGLFRDAKDGTTSGVRGDAQEMKRVDQLSASLRTSPWRASTECGHRGRVAAQRL